MCWGGKWPKNHLVPADESIRDYTCGPQPLCESETARKLVKNGSALARPLQIWTQRIREVLEISIFHKVLHACELTVKVKVKVVQLCLILCDPGDYTVHGILQARILEWVASPFSRGSSQPRDQTQVSRIVGGFFTSWATREAWVNCAAPQT